MDTGLREYILAIICCDIDKVKGGGCPIFLASDQAEMENVSLLLARILGGIVHDLENGVYLVCKH